jgi:hypothetical protein
MACRRTAPQDGRRRVETGFPDIRRPEGLPDPAPPLGRRADLQLDDKVRRLVRDYEQRVDVSHAMIPVAMGGNPTRRNAHP